VTGPQREKPVPAEARRPVSAGFSAFARTTTEPISEDRLREWAVRWRPLSTRRTTYR
jgi:hypothetical protein